MVNSSYARYFNLIKHIENWPTYYKRKFNTPYTELLFSVRKRKLKFTTPAKSLYLVFKEIFLNDVYTMKTMAAQLPEKPVVVDIGGNAGYFTLFLLSEKEHATIYAYEPINANYQLFGKHLAMNPGIAKNVQLNHRAVTGTPQADITLYMETPGNNSVTASVYNDFVTDNTYTETVRCISLEEILVSNKLEHVDLLKVDCEGSEYPIIYETPVYVWAKIKCLAIEVHNLDKEKRNLDALGEYLAAQGFRLRQEVMENDCYMVYAEK
jgi:FkbM family methyltransferase